MEQISPPSISAEEAENAYQAATTALIARRVPVAVALFMSFIGTASILEWFYLPERLGSLILTYLFYLGVCIAHLAAVRFAPRHAWLSTIITTNILAVSVTVYFAGVHGDGELCLVALTIYLTGLVVIYPWGLRGQLIGGLGALFGYPVALTTSLMATALPVHLVFALVSVVVLTTFGAYLIDRHRREAYRHALDLERANTAQREDREFCTVLLDVSRSLSAAISDPQALADRITEQARRALRADWSILYTPVEGADHLRVAAIRGAPREVADEVRGVAFDRRQAPELYRRMLAGVAAELIPGAAPDAISEDGLARWKTRAVLCQPVLRAGSLVAVIACCYNNWEGPFTAGQRRMLAAIAEQAVVALENANLMDEARSANRIKSEFVSTLSHEVRTPLNVIVGYTDLLIDGVFGAPPREQLEALQRVRDQSTQLLELIQTMLDINRLEAGRIAVLVEEFTVADLFAHLRTGIPANWSKNGVMLNWDPNGATVLRTDRGKVEVILRNLIHNALKFTDEGAVTVEARHHPADEGMDLAVVDTGIGIAPQDLPTIFEMFRQGADGTTRAGGVGLGLYIVRRLTEALGGRIEVSSEPGSGSRFTVSLPGEPPRT